MKVIWVLFAILAATTALEETTLSEFKSGNRLLVSDIYNELNKEFHENFLVSPFSLETILSLAQRGAKGQTAEEMQTTLRFPSQHEDVFLKLLPELKSDQYSLLSANKMYVKDGFPVYEDYKKIAIDKYQADIQNINFDKKKEAVEEINAWVEKHTNNKIQDILSEKDIDELTRLILVNALYFKGNWSVPFDSVDTRPVNFYPKEKEVVLVDTMQITRKYNYYECTEVNAKFLELPFIGNDASMVIVLPNDRNGILYLESKINKVFTPRNFTNELVEVWLPKFNIDTTIDFVKVLKQLGIKKAFDDEEVDFSGISGKPGELKISAIRQKTFINVTEGGVEAAAATLVHFPTLISASVPEPVVTPKIFKAEHPFVFYLKIKDVILFAGKVLLPAKSQ